MYFRDLFLCVSTTLLRALFLISLQEVRLLHDAELSPHSLTLIAVNSCEHGASLVAVTLLLPPCPVWAINSLNTVDAITACELQVLQVFIYILQN